jgi:hypothetical protein
VWVLYGCVSISLPCAVGADPAADWSELWVSKDRRVAAASIAVLEGLEDAVRAVSLCQNDQLLSTVSYDTNRICGIMTRTRQHEDPINLL